MNSEQFKYITEFIKQESGIHLDEGKLYLLQNRVMPLLKPLKLDNMEALVQKIKKREPRCCQMVIDAMTTNETFFFRDTEVYRYFEKLLHDRVLQNGSKKSIRIWSAACSYGQEPYTVAMIAKNNERLLKGKRIEIIASDISSEAIEKGKEGKYSDFEVSRGLPEDYKTKFITAPSGNNLYFSVAPDIKNMVSFRKFNLMDDMKKFGEFDFVFLRNVLLYFDKSTREDVLQRIRSQINSNGYLILGGVETVGNLRHLYAPIPGKRGYFQVK